MNILKKALTLSVVLTTIVWTMGAAMFVPVSSAATLAAGDLIKASGKAVYYYAADGKRYTFPTQSTYMTWYTNFDTVKTITDNELAAIDLAGNVVVRPGTNLVKITTVPKVFAVGPKGMLYHIADEPTAVALYGANWASRVIDIPDGFWTNYTDSGEVLTGSSYPEGTLVQKSGDASIYYVNEDNTWSKIADMDAFEANMFNTAYIVTAPASMTATMGEFMTGTVSTVVDTSQGGGAGSVVVTDKVLTVTLSSTSPASNVVPKNTIVELAKFNFTAGSKDVAVSSVKLTAGGLGDSDNLDSLTLYAAGEKVGTTGNISNNVRTFNFATPVNIPAGTTKVFSVKALVVNDGYYNLGIAAATDVILSSGNVLGNFPVTGHTMNVSGSVIVGTLTFDGDDSDTTVYVGEDDVTIVEFTAEADSVEDIHLSSITFKNKGNLKGASAGTFSLYHGATLLDTATMDDNKYLTFVFDAVEVQKGDTEDFKVTADLDGGESADTIQLYIKEATDVVAIGERYGYQVSVVSTAFDTEITLAAGKMTLNFDATAVPAADIQIDTDNIVMAKLTISAPTEAITITGLAFGLTCEIGGTCAAKAVENPELVNLATGSIIDLDDSYATDEEIYIAKGDSVSYNFRLDTTDLADNGDQYYVTLAAAGVTAENAEGVAITDITPGNLTGKKMTVVAAGLTHTTSTLNDITTLAGASDIPLYKGTLKTTTSSAVTISKVIFIDGTDAADTAFDDDNISQLDLIIDGSIVKTVSNKIVEDAAGGNTVTFDGFTYVVPAGTTKTMYLKASFNSTLNTNIDAFTIKVTSITAKDSKTQTLSGAQLVVDAAVGPTVTVNTKGEIDVNLVTTDTLANRDLYVVGGKTSGLLGTLRFDAQGEDMKIKDLVMAATALATLPDDVERVELIDSNGTTVIGSTTDIVTIGADSVVTFDEWNYTIPEVGVKKVFVRLVASELGNAAEQTAVAGDEIILNLFEVTAVGVSSSETIELVDINVDDGSAVGIGAGDGDSEFDVTEVTNSVGVVGMNVTGLTSGLPNGVLTNGQVIVGKFNFNLETGNNIDDDGEASALTLNDVVLNLNYTAGTLVLSDEKNPTTLGANDDLFVYWASAPNNKVTVADLAEDATSYTLDLSTLGPITANDVLIVEMAALNGAGTAGDYLQTKLDWSTGTNLTWDDGIAAAAYQGFRLPYDSVVSGTLYN